MVIGMPNKNILKAAWRLLTEEEIKNLPLTGEESFEIGVFYYYPGRTCLRNHISPRARSGRSCMMCREEDRIKKIKLKGKSPPKNINSNLPIIVFGIIISVLFSDNKE